MIHRYALLAILLLSSVAHAQETEWRKLYQQAAALGRQGNHAQAIVVGSQALAVAERTFGAEHPNVATSLNDLGLAHYHQGRYAQAEPVFKRALAIREKVLPSMHPGVAQSLNSLGLLYATQGRYADAERLYVRALDLYEKTLGDQSRLFAEALNNLALLRHEQGQYGQAEALYKRSLAIYEKATGAESTDVALSLRNLATVYAAAGRYASAEELLLRSVTMSERVVGTTHPDVASALHSLAEVRKTQGRYAEAEPLYLRAIQMQEKAYGSGHPEMATAINSLGLLYRLQGRYSEAEKALKLALAIRERSLTPEDPAIAMSLTYLATYYADQDQADLADALHSRALAISENSLGRDHPQIAVILGGLGDLHLIRGQPAKAEPLYRRALAIYEKAVGSSHVAVGGSLLQLATFFLGQGKHDQAEPLARRAVDVLQRALGPDSLGVVYALYGLGIAQFGQRKLAEAENTYRRVVAIYDRAAVTDHPALAQCLASMAITAFLREKKLEALSIARRATAISRNRIVSGGASDITAQEAARGQESILNHLLILSANPGEDPADVIADEALQVVQLAQASRTASAIAKMAARFASGNDALADLAKRKQDALDRRAREEAQLVNASARAPLARDRAEEQRIRDEIARATKVIDAADIELARRFPDYQQLTASEPVSAKRVRELLRPDEAMLVYAIEAPSYLWVVTPHRVSFQRLEATAASVAKDVVRIRAEMDVEGGNRVKRVSVPILHELYRQVFAPALPLLKQVRHLIIVPGGALQSLPFSLLVASPPASEPKSPADYRQVDWLARHYAISVLPSVSSIQALRRVAKPTGDQEPFAGFGDPVIGTSEADATGNRTRAGIATFFPRRSTSIADTDSIRKAVRLPETADELRAMASVLKAPDSALWLQGRATESNVKRLDLSRYRTIAFATHGVMAGDIKGAGEPGLILTPPRNGTLEDDGYLSASEVARLKLNADWVILSACNTAAADGTPGGEGLSGLARAFFHAGARSLLVSHWPVASEATVPLTTAMLAHFEAHPEQGKAEAHRRAILSLMGSSNPQYAHPLFWAPFIVVGEGGAK